MELPLPALQPFHKWHALLLHHSVTKQPNAGYDDTTRHSFALLLKSNQLGTQTYHALPQQPIQHPLQTVNKYCSIDALLKRYHQIVTVCSPFLKSELKSTSHKTTAKTRVIFEWWLSKFSTRYVHCGMSMDGGGCCFPRSFENHHHLGKILIKYSLLLLFIIAADFIEIEQSNFT